jgi:hypothetical protein
MTIPQTILDLNEKEDYTQEQRIILHKKFYMLLEEFGIHKHQWEHNMKVRIEEPFQNINLQYRDKYWSVKEFFKFAPVSKWPLSSFYIGKLDNDFKNTLLKIDKKWQNYLKYNISYIDNSDDFKLKIQFE